MDYIKKLALQFANDEFGYGQPPHLPYTIEKAQKELLKIFDPKDKITFLTTVLEKSDDAKKEHMKNCRTPDCIIEDRFETLTYYLGQELQQYGIILNDNTFTTDERTDATSKIDELLSKIDSLIEDNQSLKNGNEILFNELQELKDLFFLGKKNWKQLLAGKVTEMVAGGIISETVAKSIVESISPFTKMLLG